MANQQQGYQPPARVKNFLDSDCMIMRSPSTEQGKVATLTFGIYQNNPRITVYTNDTNDQQNDNGKIQAAFDPKTFIVLLDILREAIDFKPNPDKAEYKGVCKCSNYVFINKKKSEDPLLQATVVVGKNTDGKVYISVLPYKKERPRIQFFFGMPADKWNGKTFHQFLHGNGDPYTESEVSICYARTSLNLLQRAFEQYMIVDYVDIPRNKPNNDQNQNNGGNRNNNNNNSNHSSVDEDLANW